MLKTVLFDLDGTLADTAPDLGGALNRLRTELGLSPVAMSQLRPYTSQGVRGLLKAGLGMTPDHPDYERFSNRFLDLYEANLCVETRLFDGM
ncbi:MAG TPA: HAD hydrolase-like protein, partial [Rhodocyclaceae bacterium]|nr:HAD hydrolase-like protein [Rhodocyclaceae bacterium]